MSNMLYGVRLRPYLRVIALGLFVLTSVLVCHAQDATARPAQDTYEAIARSVARTSDAERFNRVTALYLAEEDSPSERMLGDGTTARWISRSEASLQRKRQSVLDRLTALRTIDPARLSRVATLDWQVLRSRTEAEAELTRFPTEYASPDWPHNDLWWHLEDLPRTSLADYRERLTWLRGTAFAIEESTQQLQRGLCMIRFPSPTTTGLSLQATRQS